MYDSGMLKLIYCISKKAGMTETEFFDYWRNVHGPIGARIPGLRKLVQSRRIWIAGDRPGDFDGVAQLWFDDDQSLMAARQSAEWKASTEDERNFIDHTRVAYLVTEEQLIADLTIEAS